jgi:hypothetical protein
MLVGIVTNIPCEDIYNPRNNHLNLLVRINFLNLFLYSSK